MFITWLLRDKLNGFTLVAHNGAGFDNHYLFHYLITDFGLTVDPIYSGSKLLQFTVKKSTKDKDYLIRSIDSAQFFLARLKSLPKQFGLDTSDFKKGFFPYKFDKPEHWNYVGKSPDISYYAPNEMHVDEAAEIKAWHHQQHDKVFNFRKEMLDYCLQDVRILLAAIQVAVREDFDLMDFDGMAECCTIASKTMMFFRHDFLKDNTIGVISQTGIAGHRNQSREGLLWLLLQEIDYPGLQHALSAQGEKVLLKRPVDGFHSESKTVFQFHGCFWHGCPKCYQDRAAQNTVNGETFDTLYIKTAKQTQQLKNAGYNVIEKWSCEFSAEHRQRANEFGLTLKVPQLVPKDAFYGGRTEAINLRTALNENDIQNGKEIGTCRLFPPR